MSIINKLVKSDSLPRLVQTDNFIGWIYRIDYEQAFVMTNDIWKAKVGGVPHNCFLIATALNPDKFAEAQHYEKEVVLLRVIGSSKLPMEDDLVRTKIEHFQEQHDMRNGEALDDLTRNQLQFSGLECRVLGTFYTDGDGKLLLGSDIETYHTAVRLEVYKPTGDALATMVNYISPVREHAAREEATKMGIARALPAFPIGSVRYTSTQRLQKELHQDNVIFHIQSVDFLARRTGVFGMTRTGKSNMIKQLVSVVKRTADETGMKIGQIIYDLNGEYANANQQDAGSALADVYPDSTERYRMLAADGFRLIRNNFYSQVSEGFSLLRQMLKDGPTPSADLKQFLEVSFDEPPREQRGEHNRWEVKRAIYQAILYKAGFDVPNNFQVSFPLSSDVDTRVRASSTRNFPQWQNQRIALSAQEAHHWFIAARTVNREKDSQNRPNPILSTSGDNWFDEDAIALLNMLAQGNNNNAFITGYKHLSPFKIYHAPDRVKDVSEEIYEFLLEGKIVILDLSVGDPEHRERLSKVIAKHIFNRSMGIFNEGHFPASIVIYVEEAHNIMGKKDELTEVWPRIAKEGAKFRIATVYSTQEVSSIHPNILSNTENIFVSHLNNEGEVGELSKFYDFADFSKSLIRAQDVGFDRIKTLSSPFVIPVQIHKFDPEAEKARTKK